MGSMNFTYLTPNTAGVTDKQGVEQIQSQMQEVEEHDHSSGKGVRITPAGLNINAALNYNSNDLYAVRSVRMDSQGAELATATDVRNLYSVNGDLYYNNSAGTAVKITDGSTLNAASISGIGGDYGTGGSSVAWSSSSKFYTFLQASGSYAPMACGAIDIFKNATGSNYVRLDPGTPSGNHVLTLPHTTATLAHLGNAAQTFAGALTVTGLITANGGVSGSLTGNVTGNCSGTAATVTTAAQPNITSVGTLTSLGVTGNVTLGGDVVLSRGAANVLTVASGDSLAFGGETAPDAQLTLFASGPGKAQSYKLNGLNNAAAVVTEQDNAGEIAVSGSGGGLLVRGVSNNSVGLYMDGLSGSIDTTDTASSTGALVIRGYGLSGGDFNDPGTTENAIAFLSGANTRGLVKGNGDWHVANTTLVALDHENDLQLARDTQLATAERFKHRVSPERFQKLCDYGVLSSAGDFQILQGVNAVLLGSIGQIGNALGFFCKRLGIDPDEMRAALTDYTYSITEG